MIEIWSDEHVVNCEGGTGSKSDSFATGRGATMASSTPARPVAETRLLMTRAEAARALAVCRQTLAKMTARGQLPCVRIGRAVRYSPADLAEWIDEQKKNGGAN